jgi:ATP-dependent protease ClpP protease subunit
MGLRPQRQGPCVSERSAECSADLSFLVCLDFIEDSCHNEQMYFDSRGGNIEETLCIYPTIILVRRPVRL